MLVKDVCSGNTLPYVLWFCVLASFSMTFVHVSQVKYHMKTTLGSAGLKSPEQLAVLLFGLLPAGPAGYLNLLPAETAAWLCPQQLEL